MERPGRILLQLAFQAERAMVEAVDSVAREDGSSRSDAIRKLLGFGLQVHKRKKRLEERAVEDATEALVEAAV